MSDFTCARCEFWTGQRDAADLSKVHGECRGLPPSVVMAPVRSISSAGVGLQPISVWPSTPGSGRCSLFEPAEISPTDEIPGSKKIPVLGEIS